MRNIINRKSCLCALFFSFVLCMLVGITTFNVHASTSISSFNIPGGQVKFAVDPAYNGVRFPTLMSESEYKANKGSITTGIILCDADNLGQNGQLTHSTTGMIDIDTTDLWKESDTVDGYMEAAAFVYGIPNTTEAYLNKIAAVGYYVMDEGEPVYTDTVVRSAAEIANSAYNDRKDVADEIYSNYVEADGNYSRFDETKLNGILSYLPNLTVTYKVDGIEFDTQTVRYGQKAESLTVEDKTGYEFNSWQVNGVDYNFESGVTGNLTLTANYIEKTYVYGTGFDVTIGVPACATLTEVKVSDGENAGKWYKRLEKQSGEGASSFTITANKDAKLDPHTDYLVSVNIDTDGDHPAYYREATASTVQYGEKFYRMAGKSETVFYITTDENGEFTKTFDKCYWGNGTYVNFSNLTVMKSAYGNGLQVVNYTKSQASIVEGIIESGNGTAIEQLTKIGSNGSTDIYFNATARAGLQANTTYHITVSVKNNTKFWDNGGAFTFVGVSGDINFTATTDENGEFSKKFSVSVANYGTYVKFTDMKVVKKTAYADGVSLTLLPDVGLSVSEVDIGGGIYAQKLQRDTNGANCAVYIDASSSVGLKANTTYNVSVTATTNGVKNTFYKDPDFFINESSTVVLGQATTDKDGKLHFEIKGYMGSGGRSNEDLAKENTYVIFNSIEFIEVVG